jgi:hypothetical protein
MDSKKKAPRFGWWLLWAGVTVLAVGVVWATCTVTWDPWTPIDATLISPQDGEAWTPGEQKTFSVSASDTDRRVEECEKDPPVETFPSDGLTYTWSVTARTIVGSGPTVTWIAPDTVEGDGSVVVTVTVDDEAVIPDGEGGSRDDPPVTLSATMVAMCPVP